MVNFYFIHFQSFFSILILCSKRSKFSILASPATSVEFSALKVLSVATGSIMQLIPGAVPTAVFVSYFAQLMPLSSKKNKLD